MNIILLFGGSCSERDVSFSSSKAIAKVLKETGHSYTSVDPSLKKKTYPDILDIKLSDYKKYPFFSNKEPQHLIKLFDVVKKIISEKPDLVFIGLHGGYGEDGFIQDCLERAKISYTGSNALSSKVVMNKNLAKKIIQRENVKTANWLLFQNNIFSVDEIREKVGFPCVVKPNFGGSSVALTVVRKEEELEEAMHFSFLEDTHVIVEAFIEGREITVSILGGEPYPPLEVIPKGGTYDYKHKYTKGLTEYRVPASLETGLTKFVMNSAKHSFNTLGMSVYGRIDYKLSINGDFYFLEANTLPGMTDTSLVPKAVSSAGISFEELIKKIIHLSKEKENNAFTSL